MITQNLNEDDLWPGHLVINFGNSDFIARVLDSSIR